METTLTSGQLSQQLRLFIQKGMTPERWNRILASGHFADLCDVDAKLNDREAFQASLGLVPKRGTRERVVEVDYSRSLKLMVKDGVYDFIHPTLENEVLQDVHFPIKDRTSQSWEASLIFSDGLAPNVMEGAIHSSGWMPAMIEHLLAFGAQYPHEQYKYDVVALGATTMFEGEQCAPGLTSRGPERGLTLYRRRHPLDRGTRYLKVRQMPS